MFHSFPGVSLSQAKLFIHKPEAMTKTVVGVISQARTDWTFENKLRRMPLSVRNRRINSARETLKYHLEQARIAHSGSEIRGEKYSLAQYLHRLRRERSKWRACELKRRRRDFEL